MVKRSRSAAQLQSDDCDDFVSDGVNPGRLQAETSDLGSINSLDQLTEPSMELSAASAPVVSALTSPQAVVADMKVDSGLITINVQTLSGPLPPIPISAEATVRDLKLRLQSLNSDFVFDLQKLLINQSGNASEEVQQVVLQNHRTLHSYQITESSNVALVMYAKPKRVVCIDQALQDSHVFQTLLQNDDLHAIAINVAVVCGDANSKPNLLKLYEENQTIWSINISGCWKQEYLEFCKTLSNLRPDIDIRFDVSCSNEPQSIMMMLRVLEFCTLNRYSFVKLCTKNFDTSAYVSLATALQSMPSLQTLNLSCSFSSKKWMMSASGCAALAPALQSMSSLQTLGLRDNRINSAGCAALAPTLRSMSSLQMLDLHNNRLGNKGCNTLAPALRSMSSLQTLILRENRIGDAGCKALASALRSMSSLQVLNLHNNLIGAEGCKALAPALQSMSSLQALNLNFNWICIEGCNAIALQLLPSFQEFDFAFRYVGDEGFVSLLHSMPSLQKLDFSSHKINDAWCVSFAPTLLLFSSMRTLVFFDNQIGDEGCRALAPALLSMPQLHTLNFHYNQIGADGCRALAPALRSLSLIQTLDLKSNKIGAEGCRALVPALVSMRLLHTLDLCHNSIGDEGCRALAPALQFMPSLQSLDLACNGIGNQGREELQLSLSSLKNFVDLSAC